MTHSISPASPAETALPRRALPIFAAACGVAVANIYYAQPLLDAIAASFGIAPAQIGLVVTLTQIGYAIGLVFIVPLGDLIDRRRLVLRQITLSAAALAIAGTAPTAGVFLAGMLAVGLLAVVVQVLVAFTAALAPAAERGRAVGLVTSGVVAGILAARFVAGTIADLGGWRAVYLTSAALMLGLAVMLRRLLPRVATPTASISYGALIRSIPVLFLQAPLLRRRAVLAFLIFAAFSTFWTPVVLPLRAPPLLLSHTEVGLFGLAGLAGALAAGVAGRLADRGLGGWTTGLALAILTLSWAPIALLGQSLVLLVIGVILLDLAVQAVHVTSQSLIFAAFPKAQSRLVGGYMVFYAAGSALGAIASTLAYALGGWAGVCLTGAGISAAGLIFHVATCRGRS
ncbi:MFS transporter [Tistrella mobilis]|uniref:MFS transporter n=1 Tax=Tistrella mobilis TaxID=171437 RepID=UPI0035580289